MTPMSLDYTKKAFQLTALSLALALSGCGGGSTVDSVAPAPGTGGNGNTDNPSNPGGSNDQNNQDITIVEAMLVNGEDNIVNSVSLEGAYYKVKVVNDKNTPITNAKVSFSIDATGVVLNQTTSGSILTDSEGVAQIFLKPENAEVSGAYTISATAEYNAKSATTSNTFSVQATNVLLSALTLDTVDLPSGGQSPLSLTVTDDVGKPLSGVIVNFNSSCGQIPAQMASDTNGMIQVIYKAINIDNTLCSGNVNISATTGNKTQVVSAMVASAQATSIIYTSNELALGIKNSGSSATGQVEFTIYADKTPLANQKVKLSLEKSPLGLTFGPNKNTQEYVVTTDESGKVRVNIYPGSTPGPVEIKALLVADPNINALSKNITVASSRVTQTGLSLSWGENVLDWGADGNSTQIQARMVDRNGNTVPDGTVINFTAEGGKITSSCVTADGQCAVTLSTQNPRPGDGRVSILAVAEGEKDYIDMNENNAWDEGVDVLVHNIGDTFRDDNENGTYEIGEFTYPRLTEASNSCKNNLDKYINLKFPTLSDIKKRQYEARYIDEFVAPNKPDTCNTGLDTVVRYESVALLADGSDARFAIGNFNQNGNFIVRTPQAIMSTDTLVTFRVNSGGFYDLNPMPSGTTISGTVTDKTDTKPYISVSEDNGKFIITVSNANPSSSIVVKDGQLVYPKVTNAQGVAKITVNEKPGDLTVDQEEFNCSVEMSGVEKVSSIVNTGQPGDNLGTISSFSFSQCRTGDLFKLTATSPSGNITRYTYTIK